MEPQDLYIPMNSLVQAQNAGLFVSRGGAMHPTRVISSHELIFVKRGKLDMWEENQEFHLEAGQSLHLWPGRWHGSLKLLPPDLRFYWFHFEVDAKGSEAAPGQPYAIRLAQAQQVARPERLELLLRTFLEDQETRILQPFTANLLATLILSEASLSDESSRADRNEMNAIATNAHRYIHMNFDRAITVSGVAEHLGYNVDYLGRIYKHIYGMTITESIHRRRIDKACEFLLDTNLTIQQIAARCGFNDPDYFRRIFRRQVQMTPIDYRNAYSHLPMNTH